MDAKDFKPNSRRSKEFGEREKIKPVVSAKASTKKKTEASKFTNAFIAEDLGHVKSYVIQDVVIPSFKKLLSEVVSNGLDMMLYGETGKSGRRNSSAGKVSYRSYYDERDDHRVSPRSRSVFEYDEILVNSMREGEVILKMMDEIIEKYGTVTVADMYELAGLNSSYTANKYGWTNIRSAGVVIDRSGKYLLKMPKAIALD